MGTFRKDAGSQAPDSYLIGISADLEIVAQSQ